VRLALLDARSKRGRQTLQDHPHSRRDPASSSDAPHPSSITHLEREAEGHRAKLVASLNALRSRAASTVDEVRERVSPDALRRQGADYAKRARKAGLAKLTDRIRRHPFGATALGAGLAMPVWRLVTSMPAPLLLTGAGVAALSRGGARGGGEEGAMKASRPVRDGALISAPLAPPVVPTPPLVSPTRAAEPVPSYALRSPRPDEVRAKPSPQVSAMSRVRNDVLVRTALDRPVLVGAATVALGALIAALSSASTPEQPRTARRRGRAMEAPNAGEADLADAVPATNAQLRPKKAVAEGLTAVPDENAPQKIGEKADAVAAGPASSTVANATAEDARSPKAVKTSAAEARTQAAKTVGAVSSSAKPSKTKAAEQGSAKTSAGTARKPKTSGAKAGARSGAKRAAGSAPRTTARSKTSKPADKSTEGATK
jgi:ElaB/YqjD/DUF883 family membrane-anchored ribosome-binding protein